MGVLEFINFISNFIGSGSNLWEIIWGFCLTYLTDSVSHVLAALYGYSYRLEVLLDLSPGN